MSAYKPPYYVSLGIHFMVKTPDDQVAGVPMTVEEISEDGIGALIEKMVRSMAVAGLIPLTQEEYNTWAQQLAEHEQARQLSEAMREHEKNRAIDPARMAVILAAHKGRPGGDA